MVSMVAPGSELLALLAAHPAGARLLRALDGEPPVDGVWLVGGAVRDLVLGRTPGELDLLVTGDAAVAASELGRRLDGATRAHETFGTHTVEAGGLPIDVAMARAESYPQPGALPVVRPVADVAADLVRRDFTINAVALGVSSDVRGERRAVACALEDLEARRLRVLHERSFLDDPTRLLRLVRYAARLGFSVEGATERLARAAFSSDAPSTAGPARMGAELMLLLAEDPPVAVRALGALGELGGASALGLPFAIDPDLLGRAAALVPPDGRADLALLGTLLRGAEACRLRAWLEAMHLRRADADAVIDAARDPEGLAGAMRAAATPSALHRLLRRRAVEAVALAGAVGAEEAARRWLEDLRHVRLRVTGSDLAKAGVPEGPEVGRRLAAALERKLDDGLATPEEELAAALEGP